MKKILFILLLFSCCIAAHAQPDSTTTTDSAVLYLTGTFKKYNPQKAFQLFTQRANAGESKAMNALGMHYAKGLGVDSNFTLAKYWFLQAANNGYHKAWVNAGMLYKTHSTDSAGYAVAVQYFITAVQLQEPSAFFALGYMYYKGLGCTQSYTQALQYFKTGNTTGSAACMYFTGLCYKYGYGVNANTDSAAYYITQAAAKGYKQAQAELAAGNSNNDAARSLQKTPQINVVELQEPGMPYTKTKATTIYTNIDGSYTGTLTQYDYSGKKILAQIPLTLQLYSNGKMITGSWQQNNEPAITLNAVQQGNELLFTANNFITTTILARRKQQKLVFKSAAFTQHATADSIYLRGSLLLFNTYTKEIDKPVQITLAKKKTLNDNPATDNLIVFPNPVKENNSINIRFRLHKATPVKISIYNTLGQVVYTHINTEVIEAGIHDIRLSGVQTALKTAGIYILQVKGNGVQQTTAFIKE